jgi:hypothetical protein
MSSILKVSEIQDPTNGNTAVSIDSSGRVLTPARPAFFARAVTNTSTHNSYGKLYHTCKCDCCVDISQSIAQCHSHSNIRLFN